jgi:mono/diheme cytochrome c family protein
MKSNNIRKGIVSAALIVASSYAYAADDVGKVEYDNNCAVCHGASGKGDGPYAGIINTKIPDLTTLQKANNGVFPFDRIYQMIDGRHEVKAHGTRDMPIWGREYNDKAVEYYSDYLHQYNATFFVQGRILALTSYIYSLQAK